MQLSAHFGLPAEALPLSTFHACPWNRLQYLSLLTVRLDHCFPMWGICLI